MPVITVEGPKVADLVKKREMAQRITEAAAEAFGFPNERIIIIFHETTPGMCWRPAACSSAIDPTGKAARRRPRFRRPETCRT